jgi:hypothetical protein
LSPPCRDRHTRVTTSGHASKSWQLVGKGRFFVSFAKYARRPPDAASNGYISQRTICSGGARQRDRRGYENNSVAIVIFIIRWRRLACTIVRRRSRHRRFSDSYTVFLSLLFLRISNTLYIYTNDDYRRRRRRHSIFPSRRAYDLQYYIIIYIYT